MAPPSLTSLARDLLIEPNVGTVKWPADAESFFHRHHGWGTPTGLGGSFPTSSTNTKADPNVPPHLSRDAPLHIYGGSGSSLMANSSSPTAGTPPPHESPALIYWWWPCLPVTGAVEEATVSRDKLKTPDEPFQSTPGLHILTKHAWLSYRFKVWSKQAGLVINACVISR